MSARCVAGDGGVWRVTAMMAGVCIQVFFLSSSFYFSFRFFYTNSKKCLRVQNIVESSSARNKKASGKYNSNIIDNYAKMPGKAATRAPADPYPRPPPPSPPW
jgi:hypothetical protein